MLITLPLLNFHLKASINDDYDLLIKFQCIRFNLMSFGTNRCFHSPITQETEFHAIAIFEF